MHENFLVLRASPDWTNFNMEHSRSFLRSVGLPETLIIDFAALWRRYFKSDYREVRAELKALALQTNGNVQQAAFIPHDEWIGLEDASGWTAFVDDDDWMCPALFELLPLPTAGEDGVRWGSVRLGRVFAPDGYAEPIIQLRPLDRTVYTNNYAVSQRALGRLGRDALFGQGPAQMAFAQSDFAVSAAANYLSCAVKHPCCTMSINFLMALESFRSDPRREIESFTQSLEAMRLDAVDEWLRKPFLRFREVMTEALRPR